jgi:exodeoxyribonuclease V alpha subunit
VSTESTGVSSATGECVLEGLIERITFENETSSFRVLKVANDADGRRVPVVGKMQRVTVGTRVRVTGTWETDVRHGAQVRADTVLVLEPDTQEGIERYLGSGLIPGIGPGFARRIVERFGDRALDVMDREPHRLAEVPGLGSRRIASVVAAWQQQRALRDVMVFLQGHGVSAALATRVFRRYGAESIRVVSDDPFRLAVDVWGIGFQKADQIARALGIEREAPGRLQAAVLHTLAQAEERGHVFVPRHVLVEAAQQTAGVSTELIEIAVDDVCAGAEGRQEELEDVGPVVYRSRRFIEESGLAHGFARLQGTKVAELSHALAAIEGFERLSGTELAPEQREAIHRAASSSLLVITGGPGVGKTTLVRALLELYQAAGVIVRLAAPTGRASRRMAEATGREAATVHRLLEFEPRGGGFARNENNPLLAGAIIVDESSMLDLSLAFALVRAIPSGARLVLVGDVDQLPSIGAGAVLRDVIESSEVPCVRLSKIFRQAAASRIVNNAHRIRSGLAPEVPAKGDLSSDFYLVSARDANEAADRVLLMVCERIPRQFGIDPRRDIQVLAPMHRGPAGTDALNERLQNELNPNGQSLRFGSRTFRVGDKVMQLRNDYGRDVFNGDLGFVLHADASGEQLVVHMEGRDVIYDRSQVDELTLSYACSIHKSQGSEYPAVVIPMVAAHFVMLSRNLLYTAVTRGKRLVVLVAEPRAVSMALSQVRKEERNSYLFRRLRDAVARKRSVDGE